MFRVVVLTLFPEIFPGPLGCSVLKKAQEKKTWCLEIVNIRDFAQDKHRTVDDSPYGGGPGMVMRPDVVHCAMNHALSLLENPETCQVFYMSPRGQKLTQHKARQWIAPLLQGQKKIFPEDPFQNEKNPPLEWIILCGRFEGVDERVLAHWNFTHLSIGDYILCGGELPAMVFLETCLRLIPGVLGNFQSQEEESFSHDDCPLEGPLYTRPETWLHYSVPEILLSGHHKNIQQWRWEEGKKWAKHHRPDLLEEQ